MHETILQNLLAPLGLYRSHAPFSGAEVKMAARALDALFDGVSDLEQEAFPDSCSSWGLTQWETLLFGRAQSGDVASRRQALRALLNISGDGLTVDSLNEALYGSGTWAQVSETAPDVVTVSFPGQPGVPDEFERKRELIEEILPCHLEVRYRYWYMSWILFEASFPTMQTLDDSGLSWRRLEMMVEGLTP